MIRAKFKCESVTLKETTGDVLLVPVVSGSKENESFYKYTPGGNCTLSIVSHDTATTFIPGKEYYLDFTEAQ